MLINGDMGIWQRGHETMCGPVQTVGMGLPDMWKFASVNSGMWLVERDTDVPTVAQCGRVLSHSVKMTVTQADPVMGDVGGWADQAHLRVLLEGYDYAQLAEQLHTFEYWIKPNISGYIGTALRSFTGPPRSFAKMTAVSANIWQKVQVTIAGSQEAGGGWDWKNEEVRIQIVFCVGPPYRGSEGWQSAIVHATDAQTNFAATEGNCVKVAGARLVKGDEPDTAPVLPFATRMASLQRYFTKSHSHDVTPGVANSWGGHHSFFATHSNHQQHIEFPVPMRTVPTVTLYSPATGAGAKVRNDATEIDADASALQIGERGFNVWLNGAASPGTRYDFHYTADASL